MVRDGATGAQVRCHVCVRGGGLEAGCLAGYDGRVYGRGWFHAEGRVTHIFLRYGIYAKAGDLVPLFRRLVRSDEFIISLTEASSEFDAFLYLIDDPARRP